MEVDCLLRLLKHVAFALSWFLDSGFWYFFLLRVVPSSAIILRPEMSILYASTHLCGLFSFWHFRGFKNLSFALCSAVIASYTEVEVCGICLLCTLLGPVFPLLLSGKEREESWPGHCVGLS